MHRRTQAYIYVENATTTTAAAMESRLESIYSNILDIKGQFSPLVRSL